MVESVDKRDERNERLPGGAEQPAVRDATTTRTGETHGDMSEKQTASAGGEGVSESAGTVVQPAADTAPAPAEPVTAPSQNPAPGAGDPETGARVIPFVPRSGIVRPLPVQVEPRFARPSAYGAAVETSASLPPAQPPPPTGFRRGSGFAAGGVDSSGIVSGGRTFDPPGGGGSRIGDAIRSVAGSFGRAWSWRRALTYAVLGFLGLILAYALAVFLLAVSYRWVNPPATTLMLSQRLSGTEISQVWTPVERISPNLLQAVILSEDGQFCRHRGVDWLAMKEAIEQSLDGNARGGSTISMQTVKNLFLWPSKSYLRKAIELPLAMGTEMLWSKQRTLEIYLNIAEWGPGIFGAEAASRAYFGKSAAYLTAREASLLAVALPNPIERQAGAPSAGHQRLADRLQARMRRAPNAAACVLPGRGTRAAAQDAPGDVAREATREATGQRRILPL